jgi:hypothetical protein
MEASDISVQGIILEFASRDEGKLRKPLPKKTLSPGLNPKRAAAEYETAAPRGVIPQ